MAQSGHVASVVTWATESVDTRATPGVMFRSIGGELARSHRMT
jgi:hypothetical protein